MDEHRGQRDERLTALEFPLRNAREILVANSTMMSREYIHDNAIFSSQRGIAAPHANIFSMDIGQVKTIAARASPCITREEGEGCSTMAMIFAGGGCSYREGFRHQEMEPGDIRLNPRTGGSVRAGYFSGIICDIDHKRLARTLSTMGGSCIHWERERSYVFKGGRRQKRHGTHGHLWSFFTFVDQLLAESKYLATGLGLDEQIYRLLALALLEEEGALENVQAQWECQSTHRAKRLDDLIDYIQANAHLNLTLTDLEEQSHYSGRRLQYLFKEKFDCTPMQFVRRLRLAAALKKLQTADHGDTVTNVARDIGYRCTSHFTHDFQKQFGINPSAVLRQSRQRREGKKQAPPHGAE